MVRRAICVLGLLLLCVVSLSAARALEADLQEDLRAYRETVLRILVERMGNVRNHLPAGLVQVRFSIGRDGVVTRSKIVASSGHKTTDRLALAIVPVGLRLPPLPGAAISKLTVTVPLRFDAQGAIGPDALAAYRRELDLFFRRRIDGLPVSTFARQWIQVRYTVERDGIVSKSEIVRSSGLRPVDDLGLRIVPVGLKVPPPPKGHGPIEITMPLSVSATDWMVSAGGPPRARPSRNEPSSAAIAARSTGRTSPSAP